MANNGPGILHHPSTMPFKIFLKGMDITEHVKNINISYSPDEIAHIKLELYNMPIFTSDEDQNIFVGDIPDEEFLNEMIKIKLRRST
jgi:hypothetical protein